MKNTKSTRIDEVCQAIAVKAGPQIQCWVEHAGDVLGGERPESLYTPVQRRVGGADGSEVFACISGPNSHAWIELLAAVVEGDIEQQGTIRDMASATARVWRQTNALLAMASSHSLGLEPSRTIQRIFDVLARATRFDGGIALVRLPGEPDFLKLDATGAYPVADEILAALSSIGQEVRVLGEYEEDAAVRRACMELLAPHVPTAVARLQTERDTFGYLVAVSSETLSSDDLKLFGAAARIVAVALENSHTLTGEREAARLEAETELYQALAQHAPVGMFRTDGQGRCVYVNDRWCEVTGVPEAEALERGWLSAVHDDDLDAVVSEWERMLVEDTPFRYELRCRRESREVWVLAEVSREGGGEGAGYVGTLTDITDRKRAEREKTELESHLRHAQKMEAIGVMAGGIAHDFNNLLGAIVGNAELVRNRMPAEDRSSVNLDRLLEGANRARDLVRQMLTFSRQSAMEQVCQPVAPVVDEALGLIRASMPARIEVRSTIDAEGCCVQADATQLHQVVVNLCTNAHQAIGDDTGAIDVRVESRRLDAGEARSLAPDGKPGQYVMIAVSDTGPGIPEEIRSRIFDPFFTTKGARGGSGMGLALVHGIVADHGGFIRTAKGEHAGERFEIYLPRSEDAPGAADAPAEQIGATAAMVDVSSGRTEVATPSDGRPATDRVSRAPVATPTRPAPTTALVPSRRAALLSRVQPRPARLASRVGTRALMPPASARRSRGFFESEWEDAESLIAHAARWTQLLLDDLDKAPAAGALLPARPTVLLGRVGRSARSLDAPRGPHLIESSERPRSHWDGAEDAALAPVERRKLGGPILAWSRRPASVGGPAQARQQLPAPSQEIDNAVVEKRHTLRARAARAKSHAMEPADERTRSTWIIGDQRLW